MYIFFTLLLTLYIYVSNWLYWIDLNVNKINNFENPKTRYFKALYFKNLKTRFANAAKP